MTLSKLCIVASQKLAAKYGICPNVGDGPVVIEEMAQVIWKVFRDDLQKVTDGVPNKTRALVNEWFAMEVP